MVGFAVGAQVMLLCNIVPNMGLFNGAIGKVVEIVFDREDGPNEDTRPKPLYVVVDFPNLVWYNEEDIWDIRNITFFPVSFMESHCEKRCCSQIQMPINVAKAISIHKSQGMTPRAPFYNKKKKKTKKNDGIVLP